MPAQIKHLIVLMMENRSLNHMLGFMQSKDYPIEGLDGTQLNRDSTGEPVHVNDQARYSGDLGVDPRHDFTDVMEQMFGKYPADTGRGRACLGSYETTNVTREDRAEQKRRLSFYYGGPFRLLAPYQHFSIELIDALIGCGKACLWHHFSLAVHSSYLTGLDNAKNPRPIVEDKTTLALSVRRSV